MDFETDSLLFTLKLLPGNYAALDLRALESPPRVRSLVAPRVKSFGSRT